MNKLTINQRNHQEETILDLAGNIKIGEDVVRFRQALRLLITEGEKKILLNLAEVPYIDSAGLGELVRTYTTVSRQGGHLKLLSLTKRITDLLAITKLLTVFETYDSEADAVRSFHSSANV